jgi:hypothetical protein
VTLEVSMLVSLQLNRKAPSRRANHLMQSIHLIPAPQSVIYHLYLSSILIHVEKSHISTPCSCQTFIWGKSLYASKWQLGCGRGHFNWAGCAAVGRHKCMKCITSHGPAFGGSKDSIYYWLCRHQNTYKMSK